MESSENKGKKQNNKGDKKPFSPKGKSPRAGKSWKKDDNRKASEGKFGGKKRSFEKDARTKDKPTREASSRPKTSGGFKNKITYKKKNVQKEDDGKVRLNRFIANAGICSRREADTLITLGEVKVNNKIVIELGTKIDPSVDVVHYGGQLVRGEHKRYLLLNKPKNYITTTDDPRKRQTVLDLIAGACKERLYPVGRLDRQSTGVLLLTNDGDLTKKLTHPSNNIKKIYHVVADKNITKAHLLQLVEGVEIDEGVMVSADKAMYVEGATTKREVGIELHSGKNRVIRKMLQALGYEVTRLDRVSFAGLTKKNIPRGKWRFLAEKEVAFLQKLSSKK